MSFLRQHWLVLVFIVALIAAPIATHSDSKHQAKVQANVVRDSNIKRCIATAPRAAYDIAFQYEAGQARTSSGNIVRADRYAALADAGIATVAAPKGHLADPKLVEVIYVKTADPTHPLVARLTPEAIALQKQGCQEAYSTS